MLGYLPVPFQYGLQFTVEHVGVNFFQKSDGNQRQHAAKGKC